MKIGVGSTSEVKLAAVRGILPFYESRPCLLGAEVIPVSVPEVLGVPVQPMSMSETVRGAHGRAEKAFVGHDLGIGLESGLIAVPNTGLMNICACSIYDGKKHCLGLAPALKVPPGVVALMEKEGLELSVAFHRVVPVQEGKPARAQMLPFLTRDRMTRPQHIELAIMMALIQLEHPELYKED